MPPTSQRPSGTLFLAVALVSAAVMGYEVALTRVFAVLLRYQFAFLVISLALCGLGLGGLWAHRRRVSPQNAALCFGVSAAASLLVILRGVFAFIPDQYWIAALLVLVPFTAAGTFLSAVFDRYRAHGGQLYGWDLAGAGLAAAGSVAVMQVCGAIDACLVFAAIGALAALCIAEKPRPLQIGAIVLLFACWPVNQALQLWKVPPIPPRPITVRMGVQQATLSLADRGITQPLFTELGTPGSKSKIVDTRWNAFVRTDVVEDPQSPGAFLLYANGNVPTNMMKWDGDVLNLPPIAAQFPISDWTFGNANLRDGDVLSIGPGGGLDALLALYYGARHFDGAEINPGAVSLMKESKYSAFNGGIYSHPKVNVVTAEGRAFVREQTARGKRYRLLFSALTKTATAGQGMALLESYIYTQDAFHDYLNALEEDGTLAIVGDAPGNEPILLTRLFATAVAELKARGLSEAEAGRRLAIVFDERPGPYQWALLVRKTPFSADDSKRMIATGERRGLIPFWTPGQKVATIEYPFVSVCRGGLSLQAFISFVGQRTGLDIRPCSDNRPFVLDLSPSPFTAFRSSTSLSILLGLSILGTLALAVWAMQASGGAAGRMFSTVGYFLALGVGFMLVEIPILQKLILPLGYPTLSLTVILFSLLLGGGAGALFSQRFADDRLRRHALFCAAGVAAGVLLFAFSSSALTEVMLRLNLPVRCAVAAALLLPLGFLLGTPFPAGMRLFAAEADSDAQDQELEAAASEEVGGEEPLPEGGVESGSETPVEVPVPARRAEAGIVPLIWALNGTASVIGSVAAAVAAKVLGFNAVLMIGALIYLGVAGILAGKRGA